MLKPVTMAASAFLLAMLSTASFGQSAEETGYQKAYETAIRLQKEALNNQNGWTVTTVALKSAKDAADKKDFVAATKFAQQAEALAQASLEQSKSQKSLWQEAIVK